MKYKFSVHLPLKTSLCHIRMARRRKPGKKRRCRGSTDSMSSDQNVISPDGPNSEECLQIVVARDIGVGNLNLNRCGSLKEPDSPVSESLRNRSEEREDYEPEAGLRLPEMSDTSMDSVGQPLRDVMDRLNGSLDGESWERREGDEVVVVGAQRSPDDTPPATRPPHQLPFREDTGGEPPDPSPSFLQAPLPPADFYCFTSQSPEPAASCGGRHDTAGNGEPQDVPVGHEDERKAEEPANGQDPSVHVEESAEEEHNTTEEEEDNSDKGIRSSHAAEFK